MPPQGEGIAEDALSARAATDDGSDEDVGDECEWLLGFVEPPRGQGDLLRHRFTSKVGGRPAWLDPVHVPSREELACKASGAPLQFLLQVYAPVDDSAAAFHRTLSVFISPAGDRLAERGAVRAFRCQLPRQNAYYPPDPAGEGDAAPPPLPAADLAASLAADPWRVAHHEQQQQQSNEAAAAAAAAAAAPEAGGASGGPRLFPELELVVEPEGEGPSSGDEAGGPGGGAAARSDAKLATLMRQYAARTAGEGEYTEEELPGEVIDSVEGQLPEEQRHFAEFAARVAAEPEQCLRYCFDPAAQPLWPSNKNTPGPADVPPCERCGAQRHFEFQVMPQLINSLNVDVADPHSPDWGMIAVYSCSRSCAITAPAASSSAYAEEFVWVQGP